MPKRDKRVVDKISSALEFPPGIMGGAHIELSSNREAVIDGTCSVMEFDDTNIKINTGECMVTFIGRGMEIKSLSSSGAVIKGFIVTIEFSN
ncbi:MAG: hypothetical protein BGN88_10875 [Clostridiales bacterium 43-6]|nr:MAG: hypothetical protein BGN88_10875 [Clostridiales bacterium 43-6]